MTFPWLCGSVVCLCQCGKAKEKEWLNKTWASLFAQALADLTAAQMPPRS